MIYRFCRKIFRWPVCLCLIAGVITHAGANDDSHNSFPDIRSKISPLLRAEIYRNEMKMMLGKNSTDQGEHAGEYADVLIHVQPGVLPEDIGRQTLTCGIAAARVPVGRLRSLAACSGILRIEPSVTARPLLDVSVPELGADEVWSGSAGLPLAGENVIIGIYDSGIDWSHPDFIREDNTSRILAIWDRTDESGTPPSGYSTGSEYSREQIDRELNGTLQGVVQGLDTDGHGTHVAGIAGGNGRGTGYGKQAGVYCGVAPESDLIIVKDNQFLEGSILEAVDYIFKKADALCPGRPVVVNISVGGIHAGPHDGTATLEENLSNYLLDEPGRAIVIAAGNDGNRDIHFQTSVGSAGDSTSVSFQIESNPPASNDLFTLNIWYPPQAGLAVTLKSPSGVRYGPVFGGSERYWPSGGVPMVYISNATEAHTNGDFNILIQLIDSENNGQGNAFPAGGWTVKFSGMPGRIDGWIVDALSSVQGRWTSHVDRSVTLAEPAYARLCITAGAYVSRTDWPSLYADPWGPDDLETGELSLFSSAGPARPNTKGSSSPNKTGDRGTGGVYRLIAVLTSISSTGKHMDRHGWCACRQERNEHGGAACRRCDCTHVSGGSGNEYFGHQTQINSISQKG